MGTTFIAFPTKHTMENSGARICHTHSHYEFVFCTEGLGRQLSPLGEQIIQMGDLFFFPPGMEHNSFCRDGEGFSLIVVFFSRDLFSPAEEGGSDILSIISILEAGDFAGRPFSFSPVIRSHARALFSSLVKEFEDKQPGYRAAQKALFSQILLLILRDPALAVNSSFPENKLSHRDLIEEVILYLKNNFRNQVSVDDILRFCPLSRSHFHAVFKKYTGKTLIEYLNLLRLEESRRLLSSTDFKVLDIALDCGFGSQSRFFKAFKDAYSIAPGDFRRRADLFP